MQLFIQKKCKTTCSHRAMDKNNLGVFIHNYHTLEITQRSISWLEDNHIIMYPHSELLFHNSKVDE